MVMGSNDCLFGVNGVVHGRVFESLTFWMSMMVGEPLKSN
jgi:hypothetical protein